MGVNRNELISLFLYCLNKVFHKDSFKQSWIVISGVFVAYGLAFGLLRVFSVLINPIKCYYGVSETTAMMAPGIGMLGYSIGGLFGGGLLAVIGNREGSMVFGAISALAFLACGFVHNIYFILAMIFVALFSLGVVYLGKFNPINLNQVD